MIFSIAKMTSGFNKVLENNNIGVGITYSLQFRIPIHKKKKT